jgi:transcription-repair coupling factor (superfamily II helicase)
MTAAASIADLAAALRAGPVVATGATDAWAALAVRRLARAHAHVLVVAPDDERARTLVEDLLALGAGDDDVAVLPALGIPPYAEVSPDAATERERLTTLARLASGADGPPIVIASAGALQERTVSRAELRARTTRLAVGDTIDRDAAVAALVAAGWARVPVVDEPGSVAVRGGVVDLFPPGSARPVRLELFGDEIESMRWFDATTQRTLGDAPPVLVHPTHAHFVSGTADVRARLRAVADEHLVPSKIARTFADAVVACELTVGLQALLPAFHDELEAPLAFVPAGALVVVLDPDGVRRALDDAWHEAELGFEQRRGALAVAYPPAALLVPPDELMAALAATPARLELPTLSVQRGDTTTTALHVGVDTQQTLRLALERARHADAEHGAGPLMGAVQAWAADGAAVLLAGDSQARVDRLLGLCELADVPARLLETAAEVDAALAQPGVAITRSAPSAGFTAVADRVVVITSADIFGARTGARGKPASKRARDALLGGVADFSQLAAGDYLVHQLHGVGRYLGLRKLPLGDGAVPLDFLHLEYDGGTLYLPVFRLGEVERFVGEGGKPPKLDKLGGVTWEKTRSKASAQIQALAEELLQTYAQRAALPGFAFPPADDAYEAFTAAFPHQETPDQLAAIDAVATDMEAPRAMDRLVCGDVGYGKTEVALRALFRAVAGGKQAALLAPTTVLVEQHARTLAARLDGFPISFGKLSRFQTKAEQLEVVTKVAAGQLDIVVGTHRLLSADVRFRDLGLLVIDEEQRFGVAHKERLRRLRTQLDVLTLSATPIPRTLHLAMTGLRDLSIIATPPAERLPVRTVVATPEPATLREGIERELARGGQVFFITPRIDGHRRKPGEVRDDDGELTGVLDDRAAMKSIDEWAQTLRDLVPRARVGVAHGGLSDADLERAMIDFIEGKTDVLCATTIVESGLDIPRANTMFIADADAFGLSQLYQLRGRIGRSHERAWCYLLIPGADRLTPDARKRLEVLQRFTELGAGFQIASSDLELRGGGELFGGKQSGSIAAVGFDHYVRMLEAAVAELRGQPIHRAIDPELTISEPGYIPDDYVPDGALRLGLYKQLSNADDDEELAASMSELVDRFGDAPRAVHQLVALMGLKIIARALGATALELTKARVAVALPAGTPLPAKLPDGWKKLPDGRVAHALAAAGEATHHARKALLALQAAVGAK